MTTKEEVLEIVGANPGATGADVHRELVRRSRVARWFGEHSFWTAILSPGIGSMYVALWRLEEEGKLTARWGGTVPGREGRPRYYTVSDTHG
jgi:hypothetical protein